MTAAPLLALFVDRRAGEPPTGLHPVVWMGRYLDACASRRRADAGPHRQRLGGGVAVVAGCALVGGVATALRRGVRRLPRVLRVIAEAGVLSTLLAERMLVDEVDATDAALRDGDDDIARRRLAGLVSRPVDQLGSGQIREAAIESLAENASDSIVAPLLWYAVAGLPAAAVYRFVNTADAMWGYRSVRWRWWGSVAARFDDVANWLPARITAVLLGPVPWPAGHARPVGRLARTAAVTSSPNAGWPMAAVALRWDLRLAKPGAYTLNPTGRVPVDGDIAQIIAAVRRAALLAAIGAAVCGRATT